jgi:hypothetical protein
MKLPREIIQRIFRIKSRTAWKHRLNHLHNLLDFRMIPMDMWTTLVLGGPPEFINPNPFRLTGHKTNFINLTLGETGNIRMRSVYKDAKEISNFNINSII